MGVFAGSESGVSKKNTEVPLKRSSLSISTVNRSQDKHAVTAPPEKQTHGNGGSSSLAPRQQISYLSKPDESCMKKRNEKNERTTDSSRPNNWPMLSESRDIVWSVSIITVADIITYLRYPSWIVCSFSIVLCPCCSSVAVSALVKTVVFSLNGLKKDHNSVVKMTRKKLLTVNKQNKSGF